MSAVDLQSTPSPDDAAARRPWIILILISILAGAALDMVMYARRFPLWGDECALILNIMHKSGSALYLGRLDLAGPQQTQAAPPLYLMMLKALWRHWGTSEYAMRFVPFVAGLLTLPLFAAIAWRLFGVRVAACVLAVMALSDKLTEHAASAKQYSTDLFVALVLLALFVRWRQESALKRCLRLSLAAAIAFWFSYTALFVFGGLSLALLIEVWRGGWRARGLHLLMGLLALLSFAPLRLTAIRAQRDPFLLQYWGQYFPDYSHPLSVIAWLPQRLWELFMYMHQPMGALLLPVAIVGAIHLYRTRRRPLLVALAAPIALTVLAAALLQYPFGPKRVTLFLIPSELLLTGAGLQWLAQSAGLVGRRFWWAAAALAVANGLVHQTIMLVHPTPLSYLRPAVEYLRERRRPGEPVYVIGRCTTTFLVNWPDPDAEIHLNYDAAMPIADAPFWAIQGFDLNRNPVRVLSPGGSAASADPAQTLRTPGSLVAFYPGAAAVQHDTGDSGTRAPIPK